MKRTKPVEVEVTLDEFKEATSKGLSIPPGAYFRGMVRAKIATGTSSQKNKKKKERLKAKWLCEWCDNENVSSIPSKRSVKSCRKCYRKSAVYPEADGDGKVRAFPVTK